MMPARRLAAALVGLACLALVGPSEAGAEGRFTSGEAPPGGGVAIAVWGGGAVADLPGAALAIGCDLRSAWATVSGRLLGSIAGAPAFVSAEFNQQFGDGIPGGTPLILLCRARSGSVAPKQAWAIPASYPAGALQYDRARYAVDTRVIEGTVVEVAVHRDLAAAARIDGEAAHSVASFADLVSEAFRAHLGVFGSFPYDRYRVVMRGPGDDPLGSSPTSEWGLGVPMGTSVIDGPAVSGPPHPYTRTSARDWVVHEMFHAWNGSLMRPQPAGGPQVYQAESWLVEGATVYYTARLVDDAFYAAELRDATQDYLAAGRDGTLSFAEIAARTPAPAGPGLAPGYNEYVRLLYQKGALVSYLLDETLRRSGSSLDALMRAMYGEFGSGRQYTNADVRRHAIALGGGGLGAFFDAYVEGDAALPIPSTFVYLR
ncbi:MAG: hypothetical protein EPO16_04775 [Dehalococcoidia bacterium]|nr:MAG: hypothetical protein EPO16_04775 [Dehalococcoidia bacterium]